MASSNVVCGNLHSVTEEQLAQLPITQLDQLLLSFPPEAIQNITTSSTFGQKLVHILSTRAKLLANINKEHSNALQKLLTLRYAEFKKLALEAPDEFKLLMQHSAEYDHTLPVYNPNSDSQDLYNSVLEWKVHVAEVSQSHATATALPDQPAPAVPLPLHAGSNQQNVLPATNIIPAASSPLQDFNALFQLTNETSQEPPSKKRKSSHIGEVIIIDENGKDTASRPPPFAAYPGKGTSLPMLDVNELKEGEIVKALLLKGFNLETLVREISWERGHNREIMSWEAEAVSWARAIHLYLLEADTIRVALESKEGLWLELALRRLFCLQFVERLAGTMEATLKQAWVMASPFLEISSA